MDWSNFALVSGLSLLAVILLQVVTWLWSKQAGKYAVVDTVWGLGFVLVGVVGLAFGSGDGTRRILLAVLVAIWGLRLSFHIFARSQGKDEDPRYAELAGDAGPMVVVLKIFGTQGALQWLISLPLQASAAAEATRGLWWLVLAVGVVIWATGLFFESVGDAQLKSFMADPANKEQGKVMDHGLWAWTRHPNYFGDACVWWGLHVIALSAGTWGVVWTVIAPLAMTHFLRNVSGAKLLEKSMSKRPAFQEYMRRTSYFFPRPPRR